MLGKVFIDKINSMWPTLLLFLVVIIVARIFANRNSRKDFVLYKELFNIIFYLYLFILFDLLVVYLSTKGINYIPFKSIIDNVLTKNTLIKYVINPIIIFIPLGYFISSYIKAKKVGVILLYTLIINIGIQGILYKLYNSFNIDNIILSLLGTMLGFLIYIGFSAIKKHLPGVFDNDFIYNVISIALIILLILKFIGIISFGWL